MSKRNASARRSYRRARSARRPERQQRMIALSDDQLALVREAARPFPYRLRDAYLRAVSRALDGQHPITMAALQRAGRQAQAHVLQTYALVPDEDAV